MSPIKRVAVPFVLVARISEEGWMVDFRDKVFVFGGDTFEVALKEWEAEQIAAYPHREEQIRTAVLAMRDFMDSEQVRRHKMLLKG